MKKVCHMTTVHTQQDTRIFIKECTTLFQAGYDLSLIVQHKQDEVLNGIKVLAVDNPNGHWKRMTKTVRQVYKQALECNADIYHFHDPELILIGLLLKRQGKKVIYDVHEDLPKDIYYKPWIPKYFKLIISKIAEKIERYASKKFDAVVTSTPFIAQRFNDYSTKKVVDIKNYPLCFSS